jgi:dolichol-phosphate mannosyltransferase
MENDFVSGNVLKIAVVIPAYKVSQSILHVINSIGSEITTIIVVDDGCPEESGKILADTCFDPRLLILYHEFNQGVGAAVKTGYRKALELKADVVVKLDGDQQMDASLIPTLVDPILRGMADYTKGNRFFEIEKIFKMPKIRIIGNLALSFMGKFSTGYWNVFDPTNGFTAISQGALRVLSLEKIDNRYFFESDMLFRLNLNFNVVVDIPMQPIYGNEISSLKISRVLFEFPAKHFRNLLKRVLYNYYLRDFSLGSILLPSGIVLTSFSVIFGSISWLKAESTGIATPTGTIALAAVTLILGVQMLLTFVNLDMSTSHNAIRNRRT